MPRPYGSSLKRSFGITFAYGSCAASPASTVSSPLMPYALPCWNNTRHPVSVSAVIGLTAGFSFFRLSRLVERAGAQMVLPDRSLMLFAVESRGTSVFCPDR